MHKKPKPKTDRWGRPISENNLKDEVHIKYSYTYSNIIYLHNLHLTLSVFCFFFGQKHPKIVLSFCLCSSFLKYLFLNVNNLKFKISY